LQPIAVMLQEIERGEDERPERAAVTAPLQSSSAPVSTLIRTATVPTGTLSELRGSVQTVPRPAPHRYRISAAVDHEPRAFLALRQAGRAFPQTYGAIAPHRRPAGLSMSAEASALADALS
jgi:hypothetical protein